MNTFENLNLGEQLTKSIHRLGFVEPTQIQRDSIPLIFDGKDVIGESATGSGKTLAFGAGIIKKCRPREGIQALVLVPTRELAEQVKDEMIKISFEKPIKILAIYGGVGINPQIDGLKKAEVVIATPGRMLDHLNRRTVDTSKVKIVVLDEADRMVEMGFIEDVEKIIRTCPDKRQTLLFSATMHGPAKQIARKYMINPTVVEATKMVDPIKLTQSYYDVPSNLKKELLVHLILEESSDLVMIFCNTRRETDVVVDVLKREGIKATAIHGGLTQVKRLKTIELFHKGNFQALVCTDVAARGLDITGVSHIYNFDIPKEPGDYIHRIGRTARAGKRGKVINLLSTKDYDSFSRLTKTYRDFEILKEERPYLKQNPANNTGRSSFENRRGNLRKGSDWNKRPSSGRFGGRTPSRNGNYSKRPSSNSSFSRKPFSRNNNDRSDSSDNRSFEGRDTSRSNFNKRPSSGRFGEKSNSGGRFGDRDRKPSSSNGRFKSQKNFKRR